MIAQLILSQIENLIPLFFFPHVLPYPVASVDGRFGCRSIVINSHHVARSIAHVSRRIAFGRGGNNLRYSVARGVVSEINSRVGLGYASYFSVRRPCDAQVLVVVFYQVSYGVVLVSASRGFMF